MANSLQPRASYEECKDTRGWGWNDRCDFYFIPIPAAAFATLFTILTLLHIYLAFRYLKKGGFYASLILTCCGSAIGYWFKFVAGGPQPESLTLVIIAYVFMFFPIFFLNAYIYHLLRRLYDTFLPHRSTIKSPTALFWSLVGHDFINFAFQVTGLGLLFYGGFWSYESLGYFVSIFLFTAFMLQVILYIVVLIFLTIFLLAANKKRKAGTPVTQTHNLAGRGTTGAEYKPLIISLYVAVSLLIIRAMYYVVNTATPGDGFRAHRSYSTPLPGGGWDWHSGDWQFKFHDPSQLGFDAAMVFLALLVLAWPKAHPARVLPRKERVSRETVWEQRAAERGRDNGGLELNLQEPAAGQAEMPSPGHHAANEALTVNEQAPSKV